MPKTLFIFLIFVGIVVKTISQNTNLPYNINKAIQIQYQINTLDVSVHSSLKPIPTCYLNSILNKDSLVFYKNRDQKILNKINSKKLWRKFRTESLIIVDTADFNVTIDMYIDFNSGKDYVNDNKLSTNTRGLLIKGNIGNRFHFQTMAVENQAFFPKYFQDFLIEQKVMPGMGRYRNFKTADGFDYSYSNAHVDYSPIDNFTLQFGHGKSFIGDGYRSLLLSDFSPSYPYAKFVFQNKFIQYMYMITAFQEIEKSDSRKLVYNRNHGSFSFLNLNLHKSLSIGFFESTIWKTSGVGYNNKFNPQFFNPLIYYKAFDFGLNDSNNTQIGLNIKIVPIRKIMLYGQYLIDDFNSKRYAYQYGIRFFNIVKGLNVLIENNYIMPYVYNHNIARQNYTNMNSSLAHPAGANLNEKIGILSYNWKDFSIDFKVNFLTQGKDTGTYNFGSDIFYQSDFITDNVKLLQGSKTEYLINNVTLRYLINPANNLELFLSYSIRNIKSELVTENEKFIYFGIRTNLFNYYSDF